MASNLLAVELLSNVVLLSAAAKLRVAVQYYKSLTSVSKSYRAAPH